MYFEVIRNFPHLISLIIFNIIMIKYEMIFMCTLTNDSEMIFLYYKHVNIEDLEVW